MLSYKFFDYKGFIEDYHGEDYFGRTHIIFMILATATIVFLCILCRNMKSRTLDIYLKILSIVVPIIEITKITWETYWDIQFGKEFNFTGLMPLYTCSMFIYMLPLAAWCKGKVKECAICWLGTIGVFAGATNFYITVILHTYPFFTFATFISLYFHFFMVLTGLLIVVSRYKKFEWKDGVKAFIPLAVFSLLVIPVDYYLKADYMLYYAGNGAPILPDLANALADKGLRFVYTVIVFFGYLAIAYLLISIYKGVGKIANFVVKKELN